MADNSRTDGGLFAQIIESNVPMPAAQNSSIDALDSKTNSPSGESFTGTSVDQVMDNI